MKGLLELRLAGLRWCGPTMWFFRAVADSLNLSTCIYVKSNEIYAPLILIIYMKKLLDSDWLRAVQFSCNTSAKSVTPVQITHRYSGL